MYMPKLGAVHNHGLILFKSDLVADAQHLVRRLMGRHRVFGYPLPMDVWKLDFPMVFALLARDTFGRPVRPSFP